MIGRVTLIVGSMFLAASMTPATAGLGGEAGELISARANARAGGPVSERDKELLSRYGCLSGSRSAFCKSLSSHKRTKYRPRRKR